MRSTTPSPRPPRHRPRRCERLEAVARALDEALHEDERHVLVHLQGDDVEAELGLRPLDEGAHPFPALAGFVAPPEWRAFGLRAVGTARFLDDPGRAPERTATTLMLDRDGAEAWLMRTGDEVQLLPGTSEGTIPDACRRVLRLPTAAAPPTTALLWTLTWLDRLLAAWTTPSERRRLTSSWQEIARHHPAVELVDDEPAGLDDPAALVPIAVAHHAAWPWWRLRAQPDALRLPDGDLPVETTQWMDDGFFARWAIGAYPSISTLATDLPALLGDPLGPQLVRTAVELLEPCPAGRRRPARHGP